MITCRNMRDVKSSRAVVRKQIGRKLGIQIELIVCEEANNRAHAQSVHLFNPFVHLVRSDMRSTLSLVSRPLTARQLVFNYPGEHSRTC